MRLPKGAAKMRSIQLIMLLTLVLAPRVGHAADTASTPVSDVGDLASLLEGEFTTEPAAILQDASVSKPARTYYEVAKRVDVPALGTDAVYSELRENGPDGKILRQRILALKPDTDGSGIQMKSYSFADGSVTTGLDVSKTPLNKLSPSDLRQEPGGCVLDWRKTELGYESRILAGSCKAAHPQSSNDASLMGVSKTNLTLSVEDDFVGTPVLFRRLR